jgi:hypothetical protein
MTPWRTLNEASQYSHRGKRYLRNEVKAGRLRAAVCGGRRELLFRTEWLELAACGETSGMMRCRPGLFETRKRVSQSNQKYFQCRTPASRAARA